MADLMYLFEQIIIILSSGEQIVFCLLVLHRQRRLWKSLESRSQKVQTGVCHEGNEQGQNPHQTVRQISDE